MVPGVERAEVRLKGSDSVLGRSLCKRQMVFSHLTGRSLLADSQREVARSSVVSVVNSLTGLTGNKDEASVDKVLCMQGQGPELGSRNHVNAECASESRNSGFPEPAA